MQIHWRTLALTAVSLLGLPETRAQSEFEQTFGDIETVSIATGRSQSIQTAPSVASVITAEDIQNSGARDLVDILRQVPGFYLGQTTNALAPVLAVRGFTSAFNQTTLIMIDGIPQNELALGDRFTALGKIPLDSIDRVEVIRGPGSALYGADAYSAVVNIITRREIPEQNQVVLSSGSHDTRDVRLLAGQRWGEAKVVGALEYVETDGYAPLIEVDQQTRLDALMGTDASLAPGRANTQRQELGALVNVTGSPVTLGLRASAWRDVGTGIGIAAALDPVGHSDSTLVEGTLQWGNRQGDWALSSTLNGRLLNFQADQWHFFPPGAFGLFPEGVIYNAEFDERFLRWSGTLGYAGVADHDWTFGVGAEGGEVELQGESRNYTLVNGIPLPIGPVQDTTHAPDSGPSTFSRDLLFAYFQDEWRFHPDWAFTWGLRYDHYSDFGDTLNPRAALVWNARHDLTLKWLYGRGFRAPTPLEQQPRQVPALQANPTLQPEQVDAIEWALDYHPRPELRTRLNVFYHKTDQQIRYQNDGGPTFRPENVGQQKGHGLELEGEWDFTPYTRLSGYYAYQDNTDETTGEDAGYTPHHQAWVQVQSQHHPWRFTVQARYVGERDRVAEDPRPPPDTYALLEVFTRYAFSKSLEASLDIRNLLDTEVEDAGVGTAFPGDIPLPGRTFYFSLIGRF
jgi:iron complex outermembrane receptor protein